MRPNIRHGKFIPPISLSFAVQRRNELQYEMGKIEKQLADVGRSTRYESAAAYETWASSARRALALFEAEHGHLVKWIDENDAHALLSRAYLLLQDLELDVEFTPEDRELMGCLDRFYANETKKRKAG